MTGGRIFTAVSGRTLPDLLREGVAEHPDRDFLIYQDRRGNERKFTWEEVLEHSIGTGEVLLKAGVRRGERVHVHLSNRPEFLFVWFAAALNGFSIVPTNTASTAEELNYIIGHAGTTVTVTEADLLDTAEAAQASSAAILCCDRERLIDAIVPDSSDVSVDAEDELEILYTSGTTSRPKGAIISQANFLFAGEVVSKAISLTPEDRVIATLPLFHGNAQYYSVMAALTARATLILLPRFSASRFIGQCAAHRATVGSLFSAPIRMILAQDETSRTREHTLRLMLYAQNISSEEAERWEREVGAPLLQLYGMTETIGPPLMNPIWGVRKPESIGRVSLGYACRVVDEDGQDVKPGERGELMVGGTPGVSVISGYLDDVAASSAVIEDGWLRTGDVVRVEGDGYFFFVDRNKDMIKRAGENVAASEVEAVLAEHPRVAEAAVVGVPEDIREEAIVAFVVLTGGDVTAEELLRWCTERLAKFRVPREIVPVDELPRTAVGKVQKHLLRAPYVHVEP